MLSNPLCGVVLLMVMVLVTLCVCVVVGQATCYPALMEKLAAYVAATSESRVQVDGRVVTSRAPGTTMEFAITLIEQLIGKEKADEVAGPLVRTSFVP